MYNVVAAGVDVLDDLAHCVASFDEGRLLVVMLMCSRSVSDVLGGFVDVQQPER